MRLFLNYFQEGAVFYVKSMHAGPKPSEPVASLVSLSKSPLTLAIRACSDQIATWNGDMRSALGIASQTSEFHGLRVAG